MPRAAIPDQTEEPVALRAGSGAHWILRRWGEAFARPGAGAPVGEGRDPILMKRGAERRYTTQGDGPVTTRSEP
jgi:hypothetical protein